MEEEVAAKKNGRCGRSKSRCEAKAAAQARPAPPSRKFHKQKPE